MSEQSSGQASNQAGVGAGSNAPRTQGNVIGGQTPAPKAGSNSGAESKVAGEHPKIRKAIDGSAQQTQKPGASTVVDGTDDGTSKEVGSTKIKLKVYGKERELDFNDPDHRAEIQRRLQMDVAAEQRLGQATEMQKRIDQLTRLANNPNASSQQRVQNVSQLLQAFGYGREDSLEVGKALVAEKIREEMMDPRELALMTERQKREALEQQMKQSAAAQEQQQQQMLLAQKAKEYEDGIMGELPKVDLPASPAFVRLIAQNLLDAKKQKFEMSIPQAVQASKGQVIEFMGEMLGGFSVPQIAKYFGQEFIDKIRSHAIEELQAPLKQQFAKKPDAKPTDQTFNRERKWKSWNEKQEELERRVRT